MAMNSSPNHAVRRALAGGPAVLCASVALAACGSSSSNSASGLSKRQLAVNTNAICDKYKAKIKAVPAPANVADATQAAAYFDKIAPLYGQAVGAMRALKPASGVSAEWTTVVAGFGAVSALIDQIKTAADSHNPSGLALLPKVKPLRDAANVNANALGATDCAKP
jgi:hypothetical protein